MDERVEVSFGCLDWFPVWMIVFVLIGISYRAHQINETLQAQQCECVEVEP